MTKMNRKDYARQTEREMRDQMNRIRRDASGKMTHIHGRPIAPQQDSPPREDTPMKPIHELSS